MFRSYWNTSKYFLRDFVTIAMVFFFRVKITRYFHMRNNMLFSRVKISCSRTKAHLVLHCCLYSEREGLIVPQISVNTRKKGLNQRENFQFTKSKLSLKFRTHNEYKASSVTLLYMDAI